MPRYEADLTQVSATIEVLSKGTYEFSVGEPKAFLSDKRDDQGNPTGQQTWGVRFPIRVEAVHDGGDPNAVGKRQFARLYAHNEGGQQFAKRFVMAALGFGGKSNSEMATAEREFDTKYRGRDWSIDPETGACGELWRECTGQRIVGELDVQIQEKGRNAGEPGQDFKGWRTVASLAR